MRISNTLNIILMIYITICHFKKTYLSTNSTSPLFQQQWGQYC
jgi:hypothetical protein